MNPGNERELAALVTFVFFGLALYRVIVWVMEAKRTADPWGSEVNEALDREETAPLCHHCLTPQEHNGWFCPQCGATVGPYCNYLPYINIFSQGEVLRAGVTERLRRTPLIMIGYVLISLAFFTVLAPLFIFWAAIYWVFVAENLRRRGPEEEQGPPMAT